MKIGVLGLGLIGGSIYKSLTYLGYDVIGISKSHNGVEKNIYIDRSMLSACDVIFVCTPMNQILDDLKDLENYVNKDTIVTDVASLKEFVVQQKYNYNFIPSHPMAGTEFSGFEHAFSGLFKGAKWVVTSNEVPEKLEKLINDMGAEVIIADAIEHDKAVALISHMPLVISQALYLTVKDNKLAKVIAASGFRDMTRLALSNETMACDMVKMNSDNIQKALLSLYSNIGTLIKENYPEKIHVIKEERAVMYQNGINVLDYK